MPRDSYVEIYDYFDKPLEVRWQGHVLPSPIRQAKLTGRIMEAVLRAGMRLIDEVADVRKEAFTQFHAQESCLDRGVHVVFKAFDYGIRQIRVLTDHLE